MTQIIRNYQFAIRTALHLMLSCIFLVLLHSAALSVTFPEKPFARLLDLISLENRTAPLRPIGKFQPSTDLSVHAANMAFLKNNGEVLEKIRAELGDKALKWQMASLSTRLLYVPENRPDYIELYEAYCLRVIDEILDKTGLPNPYTGIITLNDTPPNLQATGGLCAYIVHNLASEIRTKYEFQNASEQTVAIELTSRHLSGEVGSYSSFLSFDGGGHVVFTRDRFTIWQNSAQNPYTALMTPVEETLHIVFRESTETAIKFTIETKDARSAREAKNIVDEWISVEEALVGGLVYQLLPPILEKQIDMPSQSLVFKDIETKSSFNKYRFLKKGIILVKSLGYKTAIHLYQKDPIAFRKLL